MLILGLKINTDLQQFKKLNKDNYTAFKAIYKINNMKNKKILSNFHSIWIVLT